MAKNRKALTRREVHFGVLLAIPLIGLALVSTYAVRDYGSYWSISRYYIRIYCLGIVAGGLALSSISLPKIMGNLPDSVRLRGWAMFLVGVAYALNGVLLRSFLLARRNYEHPDWEPMKVMTPLLAAWAILAASSIYALILERWAAGRLALEEVEL